MGGENPPYLKHVWYVNEDRLHVFFKGRGVNIIKADVHIYGGFNS